MRNMKRNFEKRERSKKKERTEYCFWIVRHRLKDNHDGRGCRCIFCDRLPSQCINPKFLN